MSDNNSSTPPAQPTSIDTGIANREPDTINGKDDDWLTTEQVAQRLKLPVKTLDAWAYARKGPPFAKMGRYRRYLLSDLINWEQRKRDTGGGSRGRSSSNAQSDASQSRHQ